MRLVLGPLFLLATVFSSAAAFPSPCAKSGWTGLRADDGSGFIFYVYRDAPDIYFLLTGVQTSFPDKSKTPPQFFIDGVFYQTLLVKPSQFMKVEKGVADLDILKQHQKYEWDFMQKTPTPLRKLDELGPRVKAASSEQPSFTFYLWAAVDPKDAHGSRQYFLTTVSKGDVFVLSAMVANDTQANLAFDAFESYISYFQHILSKKDCPDKL
jgi:uncharacterized protein YbgA (DUF1722 family)